MIMPRIRTRKNEIYSVKIRYGAEAANDLNHRETKTTDVARQTKQKRKCAKREKERQTKKGQG